jgi:outer membrane protein OmpA-like peptidoglycan-associated protein
MFFDSRWMTEFEMGEMKATRPSGLADVNVGILSARLTVAALKSGAVSFLLGAGAGVGTETNFMHSYGVNALAGLKFALSDNSALRVDLQNDWLANYSWKSYQRVTLGLSLYRNPFHQTRVVTVQGPAAAPMAQRPDSVSAEEQARRRRELRELRDSLNQVKPCQCTTPPAPVADVETMSQRIQFKFDKSDLSDDARAILDAKVEVFRANPTMKIYITGHTDPIGTDRYNMALGERRAASAKAYLVSKGVDASRVIIDSKGESQQVVSPPAVGKVANAPNRRDMFVLIISAAPKQP